MDPKKERLAQLRAEGLAISEKALAEQRELTEGECARIGEILTEGRKLKEEIKAADKDASLHAALLELDGGYPRPAQHVAGPPAKGRTMGEQFTESPEFKSWLKQAAPSGKIPERSGLPAMSPVSVDSKQLITGLSATSAGAFVVPDDTGIYEPIGRYPLTLRDLISVRQTSSDAVEFVRQTTQVTEAAPTPEANIKYVTGATGEICGTKPQGEMEWERATEVVKTIAVYVGVTKRALADAAQIRGIIDQELREDCLDELETQLITGNGVGENFTGLINQAGILVQLWNVNGLITCRQAITTLLVTGRQRPTAFLIHPLDWEAIDLLRDTTGRFIRGDPFGNGPNTLWGVPVVQSFHLPQGTAFLANWRKAVLWDREQATITMTDSHDDWFIRNIVAVLCELRAAFGLIRPSAFVEIDLAGGS